MSMKKILFIMIALIICGAVIFAVLDDASAARGRGARAKVKAKRGPVEEAPPPPPSTFPTAPPTAPIFRPAPTKPAPRPIRKQPKPVLQTQSPKDMIDKSLWIEGGIGYAVLNYLPTSWNEEIKNRRSDGSAQPMSYNLSLYHPFHKRVLFGIGVNGTYEKIDANDNVEHHNSFVIAFIGKFYPVEAIGKGLFVKLGLGLGLGRIITDIRGTPVTFEADGVTPATYEHTKIKWNSNFGLGAIAGAGWSIPLSEDGSFSWDPEILFYYSGAQRGNWNENDNKDTKQYSDADRASDDFSGVMSVQFNILALSIGF
jgi:hypothetical protein